MYGNDFGASKQQIWNRLFYSIIIFLLHSLSFGSNGPTCPIEMSWAIWPISITDKILVALEKKNSDQINIKPSEPHEHSRAHNSGSVSLLTKFKHFVLWTKIYQLFSKPWVYQVYEHKSHESLFWHKLILYGRWSKNKHIEYLLD